MKLRRLFLWTASLATFWVSAGHVAAAQEVEAAGASERCLQKLGMIEARVGDGPWKAHKALSTSRDERVSLRLRPNRLKPDDVRWYLVFPDLRRYYKNANHPGEANAYQWAGMDEIPYLRVELPALRGKAQVRPFDEPDLFKDVRAWLKAQGEEDKGVFYQEDLGSFRFQVVVEHKDKLLCSANLQSQDSAEQAFRVYRRGGDDYLGYLTGFFNVPGIFGSTTKQSREHLGVDCADVLVAAHREWKGHKGSRNYNVSMLVQEAKPIATLDLSGGEPKQEAPAWGDTIQPGDFIAVRYEGATRYQHIGALYEDTDKDGVLSGADLVLHAGPWPLYASQLSSGVFDGHVVIFRPPGKL